MPTLTFQPRFADKVASGTKRQTIRPPRKRPIKVGDKLSLRKWSDKPYRSKQVVLKEAVCSRTRPVTICQTALHVSGDGQGVELGSLGEFAKADGFESWDEMVLWFESTHGLPFSGVLIQW